MLIIVIALAIPAIGTVMYFTPADLVCKRAAKNSLATAAI